MSRHQTPEEKARWAAYMREYRKNNAMPDRNKGLPTDRQLEVLRIYADPDIGGTEAKVAEYLGISKPAVHNHLQRLMKRLGVRNQAQAIMKLWVDTDDEAQQVPQLSPGPATGRRLRSRRPPA